MTKNKKQEQTMNTDETHFIDGAFAVDHQRWGTWLSYDKEGNKLITSLTEEACIAATRWYLKARQDGFTESETRYEGSVGGKL